MKPNDNYKLTRKIRKNWLLVISIILLIASAYFVVKIEERKNSKSPTPAAN